MEIREIFDLVNEISEPRLTVCLIGKTGSGKTAIAQEIAENKGLKLVKILPGTENPDEILGLPRPVRQGKLRVIEPILRRELSDVVNSPGLLFIDELDKAREETHAAILTLLANREVRGIKLHSETLVICAMQPVDPEVFLASETGEALSARLVFVPVDGIAATYIQQKYNVEVRDLIEDKTPSVPILFKPSARQVEFGIQLIRNMKRKQYRDEDIIWLLSCVVGQGTAEELFNRVSAADIFDPWEVAEREGSLRELVSKVPVGELYDKLSWIWLKDWKAGCDAAKRICTETDVETASSVLYEALKDMDNKRIQLGGILEWNVEEEDGVEYFARTLNEIAKIWKEQSRE